MGEASLPDILASDDWQEISDELARGKVPEGCRACIKRESLTGWSQRTLMEDRKSANWRKGITYLELNSSNVCNLQCRHCSSAFSSQWVKNTGRGKIHYPDSELLLRNLRAVDLTYLQHVSLKGGEPMLNSDCETLFAHLKDIGVLQNVSFHMVTNGSIIRQEMVDLLSEARQLDIWMSIDGVGGVQEYIRRGNSSIDRVEKFVARFGQLDNVRIGQQTSVMAYNIFSLERMTEWWLMMKHRFDGKFRPSVYDHFVLTPPRLSVSCLQDETRAALADRYAKLNPKIFSRVIEVLRRPYAGDEMHNEFVRHTRAADEASGTNVLDAVPELEPEMVLL